jgi:hypothetical protein
VLAVVFGVKCTVYFDEMMCVIGVQGCVSSCWLLQIRQRVFLRFTQQSFIRICNSCAHFFSSARLISVQ